MKKLLAAFARNTVFANIMLLLIFCGGGVAASRMIREAFPQFSIDLIIVNVAYPGADPEEVEEGISRKIEEAIEGLEGIKQINTTSAEGMCTAWFEVYEDYDVTEVLNRVRSKIYAISTFPVDAEKPVVTELLLRDIVLLVTLSGDMSERRLKEWAERMKKEVEQIPEVSQVEVAGVRDYEIGIEISEERLREYGLTFSQAADAVRRSNLNMAGGTIRTRGEEIRVRTIGRKYTGDELGSIVLLAKPDGKIITLDRVATINDGFTEDPLTTSVDGRSAAFLLIYKTPQEDAIDISRAVHKFIGKKKQQLPPCAKASIMYDTSEFLRARIRLLVRNGIIGLTLVFLLLWAFLDIRLSFWAGMGMPISIAGALVILWATGGTINMISLFGLIMVLGIIVDDAIVVGEAIYVHRHSGDPPLKAAVEGLCEVGLPVIAAVTTTMVAFIPLAYVGGIMGKFIRILPIVVIACLAVSLVECLILLPSHLSHLPDPARKNGSSSSGRRRPNRLHVLTGRGLEWFTHRVYAPFLDRSMRWSYILFCAALALLLLAVGVVKAGIVKFHVFPKVDGFIATCTVEFPSGTPSEVTEKAIAHIDAELQRIAADTETVSGDPMIEHTLAIVGGTLDESGKYGPNVGSVQAVLLESRKRGLHSEELMQRWRKGIGEIPGAESVAFQGMKAGPPGAPIEVWLQGDDMNMLLDAADDLMDRLSQFEGVYQIESDFRPGKSELRFKLKPEGRVLGLTVADLAGQIHAGYYGEEAVRLQRGRDDIRVKVRYPAHERRRISDLNQARIRTPVGREAPLFSVADAQFVPGYSSIKRTDGMRRVSVSAEINEKKANANEIFIELKGGYFSKLLSRYPGLYVSLQGEQKKMRESMGSLTIGFPLALIGIFVIIATIFRSYAQPLIIMFTVPFGIIGAIVGHLMMGHDLSMMSMFGMVALAGVVVNDAIVLIEAVNANIAAGEPFFTAIRNGGVRRFRAVILTTVSTVGGLTPLILETDLQAQFLIPMALSIAAGVAFATLLTLVLIPSLLVILNDVRRLCRYLWHGDWPTREDVEPARTRRGDSEAL